MCKYPSLNGLISESSPPYDTTIITSHLSPLTCPSYTYRTRPSKMGKAHSLGQSENAKNRERKRARKEGWTMKAETVTLILVNLAGIMERADESLLPGVYREVGAALHTDPTGLGSLTLFRSIVQSSCYPLAAYLAVRHNRAHVIALGAFLWAAATFLVAFSSTYSQV